MSESENLTHCKYGCGRNLHTNCIEVWVKHKVSIAQKITCPVPHFILKNYLSIALQDRLGTQCIGRVEGRNETVQREEDN